MAPRIEHRTRLPLRPVVDDHRPVLDVLTVPVTTSISVRRSPGSGGGATS